MDRRIQSRAVSGHRHVLTAVADELDADARQRDARHRECRDCGTALGARGVCPCCGSDNVAEYTFD